MRVEEVSELGQDSTIWLGKKVHEVSLLIEYALIIMFTLHNHVAHNDTNSHDLPHMIF